ncbi:hypothetical protein GSI_04402 [Ganoderma sinense ZZ0214-1]|uniref:Uncharacterized protein n=1 Tax=Ganoderma sinense ZZ0214-1 TaxID=1077348 RepID=A0A2G8SJ84_9APHY|nr:hypothetical protein GSI_04402 [Ganoderma sinense ZZ0214-1]
MPRAQVPEEARLYRMTPLAPNPLELFAGDHMPTQDEKWRVYDDMVNIYGCTGYTRRQHSNWCMDHERNRLKSPRPLIAARLQVMPNPTAIDVARWALELNIADVDAFRLVGALLPEGVKAQAHFKHALYHTQVAPGVL